MSNELLRLDDLVTLPRIFMNVLIAMTGARLNRTSWK